MTTTPSEVKGKCGVTRRAQLSVPDSTCTSSVPSYFHAADWVSPLAKKMMETKHSHSAKCLLLPPSSPLHYDSPLLRRNAKAAAASLSAGVLLQKILLDQEKVTGVKGGERRKSDGDAAVPGESSGPGTHLQESGTSLSSTLTLTRSPGQGTNYDDQSVDCTVFEVEEWGSKRWIRVEVIEPVTITAKNFLHLKSSFTTYLIRIETNHYAFSLPISEIRRRYSDFVWLRRKLSHHHPNKVVPPLPPKHFFNITNFNGNIINQRRYGLGKFLQRVFRSSVLLSDSALHFFLQTDLSTKEIDARISEEREDGGGCGSSGETGNEAGNNNNIPLTKAISIDNKNPLTQSRPYLFRSVSLSSSPGGSSHEGDEASEGSDGQGGGGAKGHLHSDEDCEDYCDISSSEEYQIDVEAC